VCDPGDLGGQPGLADPGLAGQEHELAPPGPSRVPGGLQTGHVGFGPHEDGVLARQGDGERHGVPGGGGGPNDLAGGHRFGKAFQGEAPDRGKGAAGAVAGQALDQRRGEDLTAPGPSAEPLSDHYRGAEEVVVIGDGFAGMDPDPNGHGLV
jgi:hypothetical protein